jgi:hypothetical protein
LGRDQDRVPVGGDRVHLDRRGFWRCPGRSLRARNMPGIGLYVVYLAIVAVAEINS